MRARSRLPRAVLAMVAAALLVPMVGGGIAGAATKEPTVTITPNTDLDDPFSDGQYVTVTWKNFPPNALVGAKQCVRGATDLTQCSRPNLYSSCGYLCPGEWILGTSDRNGNGSGSLPIASGLVNVEQDRTTPVPGYTFRCDSDHPCDLWVTTDTLDLSKGLFAPLAFQPPSDACVGSGGVSLLGVGTASGLRQFRTYAIDVCKPPDDVDLGYTLRVSGEAMDQYISGSAPFAVSSQAMSGVQRHILAVNGRTAGFAPVLGTGEVFGFRIFDPATYNQVTRLTLTPALLAKIFSGQLKSWNTPEIKRLNPGVAFPSTIAVIGRGDSCEESLNLTRWFWTSARGAWRDGGRGVPDGIDPYTGPSDILPALATSRNPVNLLTGPQAVANTVRTGGPDFASITQYGTIGYMDSSVAEQYGLPTVRIKYPNGKTVIATPGTIRNAIAAMHPDDSGVYRPNYAVNTPSQWPMPVVSYMVIPHGARKSDSPPDQAIGNTIGDLVSYIVGPGQHDLARGYAPLPAPLVAQARTIVNQIWVAPPPNDGGDGHPGGNGPPVGSNQPPVVNPGPPLLDPPPTVSDPAIPPGPTTPSASPSTASFPVVVVPPSALAATPWSKALPTAAIVGLASLVLGAYLLFGQRLRAGVAWSTARVQAISPFGRRARATTPERPDEGSGGA